MLYCKSCEIEYKSTGNNQYGIEEGKCPKCGFNHWNTEENANRLRKYYESHNARQNKENICSGCADWNSCDYIDYNKQSFSDNGALCWKQDGKNDCIRCIEINKANS